ncbi:MAG: hypothetical protein LBT76_07170 [Tannerella sp.]|jgi:hypothetical protein|nr:hypothetical protein [Tannerella sp.]
MDMKNVSIYYTLAILFSGILAGCEGISDYSVNPNLRLRFSVDTLSFDTVFSSIGSTTKQFMVYNPNEEALRIESILLANAGKSGFRINVDGRKGDSFTDIDIWKNDSLYVSVEVTADPNGGNRPLLVEDSILFYTNGIRQSVLLQACGQDIRLIRGGVVFTEDTVLTADLPYLVYDSLTVAEGATLTLEKGVTFYMHNGASLIVSGTLKANGTQEEPVLFRGDRLDYIYAEIVLPYDRIPGQWRGIYFTSGSYDNELNHVIVRNGTSGLTCWESAPERLKINIRNSQITHMEGNLLVAVNCRTEASNSEFSNAVNATVALVGGKHRFTHCTIANYKKIGNGRDIQSPALILSNNLATGESETSYPLQQAWFDNCIIDGSWTDTTRLYGGEITFFTRETGEEQGHDETFNYRFNACFIKTARIENERFVRNLFGKSPSYVKTATKEEAYEYDFRLANESEGIGKADRAVSEQYPVDRYGVNRLTGETGPSVGAYEYVYREEDDKDEP